MADGTRATRADDAVVAACESVARQLREINDQIMTRALVVRPLREAPHVREALARHVMARAPRADDDCPYGVTPTHDDCASHGYGPEWSRRA